VGAEVVRIRAVVRLGKRKLTAEGNESHEKYETKMR